MKVVFRVDSGNHIGIGHLVRCLTCAEFFFEEDHEIFFITKNHLGNRSDLIPPKFKTFIIEGGVAHALPNDEKNNYIFWLGNSWQEDLKQTNLLLEHIGGVDLIIFDHYSIDTCYESKVNARKILVIDDLMNREHFCDFLLDQNLSAELKTYKKLCSKENTKYFIGPKYALLRPEFKKARVSIDHTLFKRKINKVFVFFGGADLNGNTLKLVKSLSDNIKKQLQFTFVLNESHKDFDTLKELVGKYPTNKVLSHTTNMASEMLNTDLFIGAAGTTSWERACLGVASAVLCVADNQKLNCEKLANVNCIHYLGDDDEFNPNEWEVFFREYIGENNYWKDIRKNSFDLVDGLGTSRIVNEISENLLCLK
jgi:UDP-2,4-diacetamido-2,4,6-trideoxy-beta-L-altropyranose hydrolase